MSWRTILRRVFTKPQPKSWEVPVDTRRMRHGAIDMAILNAHICTRREREQKTPSDDKQHSLLGDYLEFGVYQGTEFIHAHHRARELMPWMRFFAFDSFEGLPEIAGLDADGEFYSGQFECSQEQFERRLRDNNVDMERIRIVPGWFDESLTDQTKKEHELQIASVVFIDCDLYRSAVPVLEFLTSLIRQGSILLFDDWYNFKADPKKGVQRATNDWLASNQHVKLERWFPFCHHGQSFIVQMGDQAS